MHPEKKQKGKKTSDKHLQFASALSKTTVIERNDFFSMLKKFWYLWVLLAVLVASRFPQVGSQTIPFSYDHGRDAVAILSIYRGFDIALIGPATSIPGLYFGSAWYYLLIPAALLTNGNPVSFVWTMIALLAIQVFITYRYFGKIAATILVGAPLWMIITTSSWNPFPMSLVSILILIGLDQARKSGKLTTWNAVLLGLSAGFGFHFSTAFAIFYPVIITLSLIIRRIKISPKNFFILLACFILPFVPQIIFEVKHDFLEVKAVVRYLTEGRKEDALTLGKFNRVVNTVFGQLKLGTLPEIWVSNSTVTEAIRSGTLYLVLIGIVLGLRKKKYPKLWLEIILFLVLPTIGYLFLHFSNWYMVAMAPAAIMLVVYGIRNLPKTVQYGIVAFLLLSPFCVAARFLSEKSFLQGEQSLLPVKTKAIQLIREKSEGKPFASYHYVSDIYDYSYQYIYLSQAFQGRQLPTEFSYEPGANIYIPEKVTLLSKLGQVTPTEPPTYIFFIVEKPQNPDFLNLWWNRQKYSKIIGEYPISDSVVVYQALP